MRAIVNETELYFDIASPELQLAGDTLEQRPTLVALHGGPGFDHAYLRPGLLPLAGDAQLVFVDLRAQGRSARPPLETWTLEQAADDVAELCSLLGVERTVVFGHSAGGFVALQLALDHPELVSGLILCDTAATLAPLPDDDPQPRLAERAGQEAAAVAARLFGGDFSPATMDAFGRLVAPYYAAPGHMDVPERLLGLSRLNTEVAGHFFTRVAPHYDLRSRLDEITAPTLAIVGRYDWVCPPAASRLIAESVSAAELVEVEDAGHFVFTESPDAFLAPVRALLRRVRTVSDTRGRQGRFASSL